MIMTTFGGVSAARVKKQISEQESESKIQRIWCGIKGVAMNDVALVHLAKLTCHSNHYQTVR
jgi:hypothetical protein